MYRLYVLNQEHKMVPILEDEDEVITDQQVKLARENNMLVWKVFINQEI